MNWNNLEIPDNPYFYDNDVVIYHGDCREILPQLPKVDLVLTDPPYGIGFDYGTGYDDSASQYEPFIKPIIDQCNSKSDAAMFWQSMKHADKWHRWFPSGFRILAACKGMVQFTPQPIQYSWDPVIAWGNFLSEPSVYHKDYHIQRLAPFGVGRENIEHPCPRPLEQVRYFLQIAGGYTALDPFMGSGTTLRAAKDLSRKAIGIEIEEKYCEVATKRLSQQVMEMGL